MEAWGTPSYVPGDPNKVYQIFIVPHEYDLPTSFPECFDQSIEYCGHEYGAWIPGDSFLAYEG